MQNSRPSKTPGWDYDFFVDFDATRFDLYVGTSAGALVAWAIAAGVPSKRLCREFPAYQKTLHGPRAVSAVGLAGVRAVCPHFHRWLTRLEVIARGEPLES